MSYSQSQTGEALCKSLLMILINVFNVLSEVGNKKSKSLTFVTLIYFNLHTCFILITTLITQ